MERSRRGRWSGMLWTTAVLVVAAPGPARADVGAPVAPQSATAAPADEVARLRESLEALRREYAGRIAALEERLAALEKSAEPPGEAAAAAPPAAVLPPPEPPASAPAPASGDRTLAASTAPVGSSKVFNPDIAVIGNFVGAAGPRRAAASPR